MFSDVLNQISLDLDRMHPPEPSCGPIEYERTEPNPWMDANEIRPLDGYYDVMFQNNEEGKGQFKNDNWIAKEPVRQWRNL